MFGFLKKESPEDVLNDLGQLLADSSPDEFAQLWGRCIAVSEGLIMDLFAIPASHPGIVAPIELGDEGSSALAEVFNRLRQAMQRKEKQVWVSATMSLSLDGDFKTDFTYDTLNSDEEVESFKSDWSNKHLRGLCFAGEPLISLSMGDLPDSILALIAESRNDLAAKTAAHDAAWQIGNASWAVDQDEGVIRFKFPDGHEVVAPMQIIGSWSSKNRTWLWGWANHSLMGEMKQAAETVRNYAEQQGLSVLAKAKIECDEDMAWNLTALAMRLTDAQGAYRGMNGATGIFMTFGNITMCA